MVFGAATQNPSKMNGFLAFLEEFLAKPWFEHHLGAEPRGSIRGAGFGAGGDRRNRPSPW